MSERDSPGAGPPILRRLGDQAGSAEAARAPGPEVTAVAAIAARLPYQGPLAKDGPLRLLYLAAAAGATGRLALETERGQFELHFKRGVVEHAGSTAPEDALGPFLLARGAITAPALAEAERARGRFGDDLVSALATAQALNPAESFRLLQEHGGVVVARALGAERGTCRWDPDAALPPSSFPLGSLWGMPCEAARRLDGLTVRRILGERAHRVASRSGGRVELAQLKLTAHEARAATLFDGRASVALLAAAHPVEAEVIFRMGLLLGELELLRFGALLDPPPPSPAPASVARPAAASPRSSGAPPPPPARPSPVPAQAPVRQPVHPGGAPRPGGTSAVPEDDAASLQAFHARVSAGDHFEALGTKRDASSAQIKVAYFQLARRYHPDAGPPSEPPEVKKLRADIFARLGEAWGVLGDDASRAEYIRQLETGGTAEVDVSAILKAEETFRKATLLVKGRQYEKALSALEEASALYPEEPEFEIWTAWVRFLLGQDRPRQHAASSAAIEAALKKAPRCMPAYLFLAQMAKIVGDLASAERHLNRGLALEPDDLDLVRELKYLRR